MHPQSTVQTKSLSVSLVLPAWNEQEVIAKAISEADAALRLIAKDYEIIVVDDGSTDETSAIVETLMKTHPNVKLVVHCPNQGYGAALRSGFAAASMDLVAFTDADCQFDLSELDRFVLLSKDYDLVCGYRIDRKDSTLRCLYSKTYNVLVRALLGTGVRDVDCALKVFRRDALAKITICGNGFLVNSEMLVQANQHNLSVVEVGVSHRPRTLGTSTVSVEHIPKVLVSLLRYWWNNIQFPASTLVPTHSSHPRSVELPLVGRVSLDRLLQVGLLLVAALFMLTNLDYPLIDRDETRYAEIPREMIVSGNWTLPQLNFEPYYDKPPLLYWLVAISFEVFGMSEASARLVPAFAAIVTIFATMWFGSRNFGNRIGLFSGLVLLLSVGFVFSSRYLLLDGILAFFVAMSLFTAYESIKQTSRETSGGIRLGWWLVSSVFVGLAFLTKGPVALVLWLPPILAFAWLSNSVAKPRLRHYFATCFIVTLIAAPWFVAVSLQDPNFASEFFITHNLRRFAGEFHARPIWFFVPILLIAGHPWSFLTIPYARFLFQRSRGACAQRPLLLGFLLLWSGWCFLFFSLSSCKLPTYVLPAAPAFALMLGHYLDQLCRESGHSLDHWFARYWSPRTATASTCLAGVGFAVFHALSQEGMSMTAYLWVVIWSGLLVSSIVLINDRRQVRFAWITSSGMVMLLVFMVMHQIVPSYSRSRTLFGGESTLVDQIGIHATTAIATVSHEFSEVPFYLQRNNIQNFSRSDDRQLKEFLSENASTVLVVDARVSESMLRELVPDSVQVTGVTRRGQANFYRVIRTPDKDRIAQRENHMTQR